jgi:hypothetical protein
LHTVPGGLPAQTIACIPLPTPEIFRKMRETVFDHILRPLSWPPHLQRNRRRGLSYCCVAPCYLSVPRTFRNRATCLVCAAGHGVRSAAHAVTPFAQCAIVSPRQPVARRTQVTAGRQCTLRSGPPGLQQRVQCMYLPHVLQCIQCRHLSDQQQSQCEQRPCTCPWRQCALRPRTAPRRQYVQLAPFTARLMHWGDCRCRQHELSLADDATSQCHCQPPAQAWRW